MPYGLNTYPMIISLTNSICDIAVVSWLNDRKLKMHFIAGLADTDGYVDHNRIHLKDGNFLKILYDELNRLGMNCAAPKVNYTNLIPFYYYKI